jgi:hypothetical protein
MTTCIAINLLKVSNQQGWSRIANETGTAIRVHIPDKIIRDHQPGKREMVAALLLIAIPSKTVGHPLSYFR